MHLQTLACRFCFQVQLGRLLDGDTPRHGTPGVDFASVRPAAAMPAVALSAAVFFALYVRHPAALS